MGIPRQILTVILIAVFTQLTLAQLGELHLLNSADNIVDRQQRDTGVEAFADIFTCEDEGRFPEPEDCKKYYLCRKDTTGKLSVSPQTCPGRSVFNPKPQRCVLDYDCQATTTTSTTTTTEPAPGVCSSGGFICASNTQFVVCDPDDNPIGDPQPCASGLYCDVRCQQPCLIDIQTCI